MFLIPIWLRERMQISVPRRGICQEVDHCTVLTHWCRVTHICVSKLTIIGSDNGLSPGRRQAIIRTNAGILLIGTLGTNFSEILSEIHTFSFKKTHLKMSSAKWRPFCFGLNLLRHVSIASCIWRSSDYWVREWMIKFGSLFRKENIESI